MTAIFIISLVTYIVLGVLLGLNVWYDYNTCNIETRLHNVFINMYWHILIGLIVFVTCAIVLTLPNGFNWD